MRNTNRHKIYLMFAIYKYVNLYLRKFWRSKIEEIADEIRIATYAISASTITVNLYKRVMICWL